MSDNNSLNILEQQYANRGLNHEEHLEAILEGIRTAPGFTPFLKCVYSQFYHEPSGKDNLSQLSNEELQDKLILLQSICSERHDGEIPPLLNLLVEMMGRPDYHPVVRWGISRLVGLAATDHLLNESA